MLSYMPEIVANKVEEFLVDTNISSFYKSIVSLLGTITAKSAVFLKDMILIVIFFFFTTVPLPLQSGHGWENIYLSPPHLEHVVLM